MARGEEGRPLTGPQKAAALMLALGEAQCAQLFSRMHEDEIKEISGAMAQLGPVRSDMVERLCTDFTENLGGAGDLVGSYENTERLLTKTLPRERVFQIMEEIRGPAGRTMWDKLGNVNEGVLANYLKNEYPQTVAVVLSKVRSDHAARVLALLPDAFAMEVVMRMLRMESVQKDVLEGVEKTLRAEFMSNLARSTRRDAHEMMADIFNNLDRQSETRFVGALEERNREAAERIKSLMFTFDDLQRLTPQAVQVLLRSVDKSKLPVALKGASEKLRDLFFSNLSERAGKMLREEIEALGPVRLRDVDEAQGAIVTLAKDMAAQGQIEIRETNDEELVLLMLAEPRPAQMAELPKFFGEDFGGGADDPADEPVADAAPPPIDPDAIRAAAYQEGLRDGIERADSERNRAVSRTLATLEQHLGAAQYQAAQETDRAARSIASLLIQALMKILPAACARFGAAEIADVARAVLPGLRQEPRVVVAVHPAVAAEVEAELARLGDDFRERAALAPTETLAPGDVRITWQDGSAARDTKDLMQRIAALFTQYGLLNAPEAGAAD